MPIKIFTTIEGKCPFGKGCAIDTQACRACEWYFRSGTGTFFWCKHPTEDKPKEPTLPKLKRKHPETLKKMGRPRKETREKPSDAHERKKQ